MLLRNYINKMVGKNGSVNALIKTTAGAEGPLQPNLQTTALDPSDYSEAALQIPSANMKIGIAIGSGTTSPSINDYKMENAITSNIKCSNSTISYTGTMEMSNLVASTTVKNTGSEDISISEIGLFGAYSATVENTPRTLFTRDVITPVVIAPNETKTIVVTIDFAQMASNVATS